MTITATMIVGAIDAATRGVATKGTEGKVAGERSAGAKDAVTTGIKVECRP